jgi:hypothetical protein
MGEELADRPNDSQVAYLTLVGTPGEARFESLKVEFENHAGLKEVTQETHFSVMADTSTMFRTRYSGQFGRLPTVRLQEADGDVLYEASGRAIPTADELYTELSGKASAPTCFRRQQNGEQEMIDVTPIKSSPKPTTTAKKPKPVASRVWMIASCVGAVLVGWCIGVGLDVRNEWSGR